MLRCSNNFRPVVILLFIVLPQPIGAEHGTTALLAENSPAEHSFVASPRPPAGTPIPTEAVGDLPEDLLAQALGSFELRNIGPFRPGAWVTAIAVPEVDRRDPGARDRHTFYIGARNGGVWKTVNNGTTFRNMTDTVDISAVGSIAIGPSDPNLVWVGTGDAENARSSYSGNGVWKSLDGGETWRHMGLDDSHHVARIVVHPRDPDTVWVAAMGHLFSENTMRGVFQTSDGGKTWRHTLDLGPRIGVIDLAIDPGDSRTLYAASYDKQRLPWHFEAGGEGSRVYRSRDGGKSWAVLAGGLPVGILGRIGIDVSRADPRTLFAVIENLNTRPPTPDETRADQNAGTSPQERTTGNEIYRSDDRGATWRRVSPLGLAVGSKSAYAFNEIRIDPRDRNQLFVISESLLSSIDGGVTWRDLQWPPKTLYADIFGDVRAFWIDPRDPGHQIVGSDGGVFVSWDGGATADHLNHLPIGEVYDVATDLPSEAGAPYRVYAGLQDHEVWRAPINSWSGFVTLEDWVLVGRWDGMVSQVSPDGRYHYSTTQFGGHLRTDLELGQRIGIEPKAAAGEPTYRFQWTPPIQISPHDADVLWAGSQKLLRSPDRGDHWQERSPDLTRDDPTKIVGAGHIHYCTISTLAESALLPGLVWVGTDDGLIWMTRDSGETWTERSSELLAAGAPDERFISRVVPSRHESRRIYVSKSGYRNDDFGAYLFVSEDLGATWRRLGNTAEDPARRLPEAPISVVVEDSVNADLLFVGNDQGVWVSLDRGDLWFPFADLPRVPIRDLEIHPSAADLVVGTYGRGVWVGDVHVLRELTPDVIRSEVFLFSVEPKPTRLTERDDWGDQELSGNRHIKVANEPDGLTFWYWLGSELAAAPRILVRRPGDQEELVALDGPAEPGLHSVSWNTHALPLEPGEVEVRLETAAGTATKRSRLLATPKMPVRP